MTYTIDNIKDLRISTGAGFLDCKKALEENSNDIQKSIDYLRKKGLAKASKKSSRQTNDGAVGGFVTPEQCRKPEIVSDAAYIILSKNSKECTRNFFIDEDLLKNEGEKDFEKYAVKQGSKLFEDLFLD